MRIYHGKILSLDKDNNIHNYLVEDKGRIVYLGDSLSVEYAKNDSVVELGNRALLPSFGTYGNDTKEKIVSPLTFYHFVVFCI